MREKGSLPLDKREWHPSPPIGQIVLVTTLNADGQSNVAPKSWITMAAFDPPMLALGCNLEHWTAQNILRSGEFVVNARILAVSIDQPVMDPPDPCACLRLPVYLEGSLFGIIEESRSIGESKPV
jgi:hypothetical protein